jgi:5-methylcytosine-specific restriction enzyme A
MPYKPKHPCKVSFCKELVPSGEHYCSFHRKALSRSYEIHQRDHVVARLYHTKQWKALRVNHLRSNPFCVQCSSTRQLEVDHIIEHAGNPDLFFDETNLQTLCKSCHSTKTLKGRV